MPSSNCSSKIATAGAPQILTCQWPVAAALQMQVLTACVSHAVSRFSRDEPVPRAELASQPATSAVVTAPTLQLPSILPPQVAEQIRSAQHLIASSESCRSCCVARLTYLLLIVPLVVLLLESLPPLCDGHKSCGIAMTNKLHSIKSSRSH